jgi:hypothetical protein
MNWADEAFDVFCTAGSVALLACIAATLYGWPASDPLRFW